MAIESRRRSVVKVISWRITATLTTTLISWAITGSYDLALKIGIFELVLKLFIQYMHERIWNNIKFGIKPVDYQI